MIQSITHKEVTKSLKGNSVAAQHLLPYESAADVFRCKWNLCILRKLGRTSIRYSALKKKIGGIAVKVLNERLRRLEASALIARTSFPGYPLRVEYALTGQGRRWRSLLTPIGAKNGTEGAVDVVLRCKWMPAIMQSLAHDRLRPRDLKRRLPGISNKILTDRLRELQRWGLIRRTVYQDSPLRVEYAITRAGTRLCALLKPLQSDASPRREHPTHQHVSLPRLTAGPTSATHA